MLGGQTPVPVRIRWGRSELFHQHERFALPVVEPATVFGQVVDRDLDEAALEEPVLGARGEHEDAREATRPRALLDALEEAFAVAGALRFGCNREARHFADAL